MCRILVSTYGWNFVQIEWIFQSDVGKHVDIFHCDICKISISSIQPTRLLESSTLTFKALHSVMYGIPFMDFCNGIENEPKLYEKSSATTRRELM